MIVTKQCSIFSTVQQDYRLLLELHSFTCTQGAVLMCSCVYSYMYLFLSVCFSLCLFNVEYADVLGIQFDFTAKPVVAPPKLPRETVLVHV